MQAFPLMQDLSYSDVHSHLLKKKIQSLLMQGEHMARASPLLLKRMIDEGHELGNHMMQDKASLIIHFSPNIFISFISLSLSALILCHKMWMVLEQDQVVSRRV